MYSQWRSLLNNYETCGERASVLERLPIESAKDIVTPVAKHIVSTLGISQPPEQSPFTTDAEVEWCLQVVCYGLSLQLSEHEIIKDCVNIYCEWLTCLLPNPRISVPKPIVERPNFFARKIINHLYHLFVPRKGEGQDTIKRQAVFCHRVLRTLQNFMKSSEILEAETWECVLLFLISICDAILSPPTSDIGEQLSERVLTVLFEIWILSCGKCFPSPSLWKTLRESCLCWRHRPNLFEQWNRVNLSLSIRVLTIMYGEDYVKIENEDDLLPEGISNDCIMQTWFRFLHSIGNPVELTQPTIISQTQSFLQYAIASQDVVDPCQHPCLSILPLIFHKAICGISVVVDAFLGVCPVKKMEVSSSNEPAFESPAIASPVPPLRRLAKSFSVSPSSNVHKGISRSSILGLGRSKENLMNNSSQGQSSNTKTGTGSASSSILSIEGTSTLRSSLSLARPNINSILHLFGPWLFEASLVGTDEKVPGSEIRRASRGSIPAALPENIDIPSEITIDKYYQGRAEALGILCRIFCSKKTGEEILPAYLARFYIAVAKGLKDCRSDVVHAILSNSSNLFQVDLDGISILLPVLVPALEGVLPNKEIVSVDLRRSSIQLLLSLLPLPLHFMNLTTKDISDRRGPGMTFLQLKPMLGNILMNTLQVETDSHNIQMLLGGLILFVIDTTTYEERDRITLNITSDSPSVFASSECASMRSTSEYSNSFDEHTMGLSDTVDGQFDSSHALLVRATYLVCHRLVTSWKTDLPVSLTALELLIGLAKIKVPDQDPVECRRVVNWVCEFIIYQCARPPQAHSKDLHSSIVAAFHCVRTWLVEHPHLLEDKESLTTVMEVVEYGISGTKSHGMSGEDIKMKDEKEVKPVSLRVRDAAEALLAVIFEQVGTKTSTYVSKASTLLDEVVILKHLNQTSANNLTVTMSDAVRNFRYFVIDNSILVALLEDALDIEKSTHPSVTVILRCPTGRHVWNLQLRHMPLYKEKSTPSNSNNPGRPLPMNDLGTYHNIEHRYFPESIGRVIQCKADKVLQSPESLLGSPEIDSHDESRFAVLLEKQIQDEKRIANRILDKANNSYTSIRSECIPPPVCTSFQTARLLLSNLGFFTLKDNSCSSNKITSIDSQAEDFASELGVLDSTSPRTFDTVHIFYVRAGQRKAEDILSNIETKGVTHPHFSEFLLSLGLPVSIDRHYGWTGILETSWKRPSMQLSEDSTAKTKAYPVKGDNFKNNVQSPSFYNGESHILHWCDTLSEIAFLVPTRNFTFSKTIWEFQSSSKEDVQNTSAGIGRSSDLKRSQHSSTLEHSTSMDSAEKPIRHTLHLENTTSGEESSRMKKSQVHKTNDAKIFVVWLENYEDSLTFPASDLLQYTWTGLESTTLAITEPSLIIFIHLLKNGLFHIRLSGKPLRMGLASPLIDGMIVSRRILGSLVRQTSLNMARRKCLENDQFQPPHVRRKMKIQEILHKFPLSMSESDFFSQFYKKPDEERDLKTYHYNDQDLSKGVKV